MIGGKKWLPTCLVAKNWRINESMMIRKCKAKNRSIHVNEPTWSRHTQWSRFFFYFWIGCSAAMHPYDISSECIWQKCVFFPFANFIVPVVRMHSSSWFIRLHILCACTYANVCVCCLFIRHEFFFTICQSCTDIGMMNDGDDGLWNVKK